MTKKYKQTVIPSVKTGVIGNNKKAIADYYKLHLSGVTTKPNRHIGVIIKFNKYGQKELAYGRATHAKKTALMQCLPLLLEVAEYNNFGIRKPTDVASILGYMNFKAFVVIDGKKECARITCILRKDGNLYYNHEISIKKISKQHRT